MATGVAQAVLGAAQLPLAVQEHLARAAHHHQALAWNANLAPSVVRSLYGPITKSGVAAGLVSRPLDHETLELVIDERGESRSGVVKQLWRHNRLTEELAERLAASRPGVIAADAIVRDAAADASLRALFAHLASPRAALDFLEANAGVLDVESVATVVVAALISGHARRGEDQMTNPHTVKALRVLALHPGAADHASARCDEHAAIGLVCAALQLGPEASQRVLGAATSLTTPGWGATTALATLAMLADRPDTDEDVAASSLVLLARLPNGDRAQSRYRVARGWSPYGDMPRTSDPLAIAHDTAALEAWVSGRAWRCDGFSGWQQLRAYQFADLALNEHLDATQARHVADTLCQREVRATLGRHLVRSRCETLRERHPKSVRRMPALPPSRRRAEPKNSWQGWRPETGTPGDTYVDDLWHPAHLGFALEHLTRGLGEDPVRWELALGLADTFDGTVEELIGVVEALTP